MSLAVITHTCGTIVAVADEDENVPIPAPPCPTCALKAEFEAKLKALERRAVPSLVQQLKRDRDL
jgi:hypothetical protein